MIKIEKNKSYEFRFLPNLINIQSPAIVLEYTYKNSGHRPTKTYFSYVYVDGKVEILRYGIIIKKMIESAMIGCTLTSEGYYIGEDIKADYYYADRDKNEFLIDTDNVDDEFTDDDGDVWYRYDDLRHVERFNIFSPLTKYTISFNTTDESGFMKINHIGLTETNFIWTREQEFEFKSLYYGVQTLEDAVDEFKEYLKTSSTYEVLFRENNK